MMMVIVTLIAMTFFQPSKNLTLTEFYKLAEDYEITEVNLTHSNNVIDVEGVFVKDKQKAGFTTRISKVDELLIRDMLIEKNPKISIANVVDQGNFLVDLLMLIVPYAILGGIMFFILSKAGGGGNNKAFEFSKSRAKVQGNVKVRFDDVAGAEEEKEEIKEIIDYLKAPKKFEEMGARIPKGVLLVGPPGTGKTLLARAAAGEADVPYYSISGSDFVEMFVGVGASRVRDMFKKAKETAPCIIFIDEIDAVGRQRGAGMGGGNDEREQTLNQLLVEMDGIEDNSGVVIIAATNRDDVLDPALLRPGRFDRKITVGLPDVKGRTAILGVHARNKFLAKDVTLENIARRTPGFSGADLENVLNEAAILAVRDNKKEIDMVHLDEAIDRVIMGPAKKSKKYSEKERYMVAVHEAGHTIVGLKLESADMVQKVTIIPRGDAGGYNLMTPREETFTQSKSDLLGKITGYLGGRVAEEIVFDEISTGAYGDIQSATKIARAMVMSYGMSNLGPIQYENSSGNVFLGRDYSNSQTYSGEIAFEIDKEVRRIIDEAKDDATKLITEHRDLLDRIVEGLLEHETLTSEQIQNIVENRTALENAVDVEVKEETV
ncbi:MAG: ATP-dependent zinc metalloprotease FtsH [Erysipelothrix sp.]|nr:ATP-dependent zinc metalloprotease FtsH [Erysipelothrix sp.]